MSKSQTINRSAELIPCPICGDDATASDDAGSYYAYCGNSESCPTRPCTQAHPTPESAAAAWNNKQTR